MVPLLSFVIGKTTGTNEAGWRMLRLWAGLLFLQNPAAHAVPPSTADHPSDSNLDADTSPMLQVSWMLCLWLAPLHGCVAT